MLKHVTHDPTAPGGAPRGCGPAGVPPWRDRARAWSAWPDALVVVAVVLCSLAPYITVIGFYSDDWSFVELSRYAETPSVMGTVRELRQYNRMRPIGDLTRALQLKAFDDQPRGYHVVNSAMLLLVSVLFWLVLREIGVRRDLALATALIFAVMPHYSTLRFWFSSGVANISNVLFLVSVLIDLKVIKGRGLRRLLLRSLSMLCLAASLLTYELVLPLAVAVAVGAAWLCPSSTRVSARRLILWGNLAVIAAVFAYKASIPDRLGYPDRMTLLRVVFAALTDPAYGPGASGLNVQEVLRLYGVTYGLMLPVNAVRLALRHPDLAVLLMALLSGAASWGAVHLASRSNDLGTRDRGRTVLGMGIVAFLLGYAIFLTNGNIQITPTGTGNRTAGAAALGAAMILAAGLFHVTRALGRYRRALFAGATGTVVFLCALITGTLATFWKDAYTLQVAILSQLREDVPALSSPATLLVDGICMYQGPAPVFEAPWDLQSALRIAYGDAHLRADVVNQTLRVEPDGIHTAEYDTPSQYPFDNLRVYDVQTRRLTLVQDYASASAYFGSSHPRGVSNGCPQGYGGWGVPVF